MRLSSSIMTLVMLAIFVVLVVTASSYPANARFMPLVVGIPAIALCLLQLALDARKQRSLAGDSLKAEERAAVIARLRIRPEGVSEALPPADPEPKLAPRETVRRELILWAYFLALLGGILLVGFWVTIPPFLVTFLRFQAKASWPRALIMSLVASLVLFLVLEQAFRMELHRGFVTEYLQDRLGGVA